MSRLLTSGFLTEENQKRAIERREHSERSAHVGLDLLNENAKPTELGEGVLESLRSYWATACLQ
jgi:hypothetical protein